MSTPVEAVDERTTRRRSRTSRHGTMDSPCDFFADLLRRLPAAELAAAPAGSEAVAVGAVGAVAASTRWTVSFVN